MADLPYKIRLTVDITYNLTPDWVDDGDHEAPEEARREIRRRLDGLPGFLSGNGMLSGDQSVEVTTWEHRLEDLPC